MKKHAELLTHEHESHNRKIQKDNNLIPCEFDKRSI